LSSVPPERPFPTSNVGCPAAASGSPQLALRSLTPLSAALDALAIAGKAGAVVSGFAKVEAAFGRDKVLALIHAADAANDGKRKLAAALHRNSAGESGGIVIIEAFTGAQLDLALSRPNVVHAALLAGSGSETFLARVARLTRFRTGFSPDAVSAHAPTDGA
jgi:hypothetical protein